MAAIIICDMDECDELGAYAVVLHAHHPADRNTIWPVMNMDACSSEHAAKLAQRLLDVDALSFQEACVGKGGERASKLPVDKWHIHEVSVRPFNKTSE